VASHRGRKALVPLLPLVLTGIAAAAPYTQQQTYLGEVLLDQFGYACAPAGDVDSDGFGDFLVGANVNDEGVLSGGKAYLYLGGASWPAAASLTFAGAVERGYVGGAVAGGDDLDGDGHDDWVVGAPGIGADGTNPGRVYVFRGGPALDAVPDAVLDGPAPTAQFGTAVCLVPDLDGDGIADLAVGAPRDGSGSVSIWRGRPFPWPAAPDRVLRAEPADARFGRAVTWMPDDDGDGRDDLLVGAPRSSEAATWAGVVRLYRGTADLDSVPDILFPGEAAGDEFGTAIAAGADVNGDGEPDIVVEAPNANVGPLVDAGRTYVFHGGTALDTIPDLSFDGTATDERSATSIAIGFDWDDDGGLDIAVGSPDAGSGGADGVVRVYRGGAALDAISDVTIPGASGSHLGRSLAFAGDVRHNGRGALLAGGYDATDSGRILLFGTDDVPTAVVDVPAPGNRLPVTVEPNPVLEGTTIRFRSSATGTARVDVFDAAGRSVRAWDVETSPSAASSVSWDGRDASGRPVTAGVYFVRVRTGTGIGTGRLVRVR